MIYIIKWYILLTNSLPSQTKWGKGGVVIPGGGIIKPGGETWEDLVESLEFSWCAAACAAADFKSSCCCFNNSNSFAWSEIKDYTYKYLVPMYYFKNWHGLHKT